MTRAITRTMCVVGFILAMLTPHAAASHLDTMNVTASSSDLTVTLHVEYTTTGGCCGGTFNWDTGDGATGSLADGTSNGNYAGDASGSDTLSDGRSFTWTRTGPSPVRIDITYDYTAYGTYTINWDDCCPDKSGSLDVTLTSNGGGGGGGGGGCSREVGVATPEFGASAYIFVGDDRQEAGAVVPSVGAGVCAEGTEGMVN